MLVWLHDLASRGAIGIISLAVILGFCASKTTAAPVDFGRDVVPILSDNCYQCHGPDEKARKGKLRFDNKEGAFRLKEGKAVIIPGRSSESELVRRITTSDPDDLMPPPDSNRKLTANQIELLKRWIDEGAKWTRLWAFIPPEFHAPPKSKFDARVRNSIDRFIFARLEKEGLSPSAEAKKETLLRRVTLDITGLPPTPAEIDAFMADASPEAYEKVVSRLLDSPRYGERMTSDWLDVARYADTHGYQADRYRPMWPWRDWVIKAFNENLPYDRFLTWQLAGDLLPHATKEQKLATGFNRNHLQNEEGGIVEEEYRVAYVVDRVDTMGTAFLGLTFECCRCHDHKFDPISQKDFYSLFAFFQNIDESGQTAYFTDPIAEPTLLLSDEIAEAKIERLQAAITQKEEQLPAFRTQARGSFEEWLRDKTNALSIPGAVGEFNFEEMTGDRITNLVNSSKSGRAQESPRLVPGKFGMAAELSGENGFTFPDLGHFARGDSFSFSLWLLSPTETPRSVVLHHSKAPIDAGSRGYELLIENGHIAFGLHHMWPGNSLKVLTQNRAATNQWFHVAVTYDGSSRAEGVKIFLDGQPAMLDVVRDGLVKDITYAGGEPDLSIGYRFRDSGFKGGLVDNFQIYNRALTAGEVSHLAGREVLRAAWETPAAKITPEQKELLLDYYIANLFSPARKFRENLRSLRQEQSRLVEPIPEVMVMREMAKPKPAFILKRGAYDAHGEAVTANTPSALPPFPADQPRNRLGLAKWLVERDNPLTARVTVNRIWQMMLGKGIVETSDNFGSQGDFPTHPDLLDWLALDFIDSGWDLKKLVKTIAMSATYRQTSQAAPELLARDPGNQLLARGPARRLTAEMLRDQALALSGLLVEKIGGPAVKPYQPEGLWEEKAMGARYDQGKGEDLHRRSLYTFWKRTIPHPAMLAFDAAERNGCTARRQSTSTPLQALTLLNDTQIVEASRALGERILREGGRNLDDQLAWGFRLATGRRVSSREALVLKQLFLEQRELFTAHPDSAAHLMNVGEVVSDPRLELADLAASTILAEALLNHDEAIMRR